MSMSNPYQKSKLEQWAPMVIGIVLAIVLAVVVGHVISGAFNDVSHHMTNGGQ